MECKTAQVQISVNRQVNLAGAVHFTGHNHFTRAMEALFVSALTLSGDLCVGGDFPYLDN